MDLRLVEYFVAVVDHGSVTKAAQALYIAQPSLSQAIRTLERHLDVQLFDRTGHRFVLSPDGQSFLGPARRILRDVAQARAKVESVRDLRAGRLDMAALSSLSIDPLPRLLAAFRRHHPQVVVNVADPGASAGLVAMVREGGAELGLADLPVKSDTLRSTVLDTEELTVVLPPGLAAGLPDPVPLDCIAGIPLVLESSESMNHGPLHRALSGAGGQVAVECAHRQAIWELVMNGAGATILPRRVAESELRGVVVRSTEPPLRRRIGLVYRPGALSPAATAFITISQALLLPRRADEGARYG